MSHSINNIMEVVLESMWTGVKENEDRRIWKKREKIEKADKLKSDWWTSYNVTGILKGIMEEAWVTITLKEDSKIVRRRRRSCWQSRRDRSGWQTTGLT